MGLQNQEGIASFQFWTRRYRSCWLRKAAELGAETEDMGYGPLRSNGTINNGKKAEWPVEQVEGLVTQPVIRAYCLLSSSLSLEPARLKPPVKPKEIFAMAAKIPYRCLSFRYSSEAGTLPVTPDSSYIATQKTRPFATGTRPPPVFSFIVEMSATQPLLRGYLLLEWHSFRAHLTFLSK
jgi:hypothetical protein